MTPCMTMVREPATRAKSLSLSAGAVISDSSVPDRTNICARVSPYALMAVSSYRLSPSLWHATVPGHSGIQAEAPL